MSYQFTGDDVAYLRSDEGQANLDAVNALSFSSSTLIADTQAARGIAGERFGAVVETVRVRRRLAGKLDDPRSWLATDDAAQQSTASAVARHRGARLAGRTVHDVTCSIGTELRALSGVAAGVIGSDLDAVRLAMAAHNAPDALLLRADALAPVSRDAVIMADPARRSSSGVRRFRPQDLMPPLPDLVAAYPHRPLVVKCAPGVDFAWLRTELGWTGEIEITSLGGSVREACLWGEQLADPGVTRRASVLTDDGGWQITDAEPDDIPDAPPGRWIIDPDGAVVRAGLVRHWAARHGLWQLDPQIAYLTGDRLPPGVRGHEVIDQVGFAPKKLRSALRELDCGALEILVRGVDVDPDRLRTSLKLTGTQALSAVVTRIGRNATVFLCRPVRAD